MKLKRIIVTSSAAMLLASAIGCRTEPNANISRAKDVTEVTSQGTFAFSLVEKTIDVNGSTQNVELICRFTCSTANVCTADPVYVPVEEIPESLTHLRPYLKSKSESVQRIHQNDPSMVMLNASFAALSSPATSRRTVYGEPATVCDPNTSVIPLPAIENQAAIQFIPDERNVKFSDGYAAAIKAISDTEVVAGYISITDKTFHPVARGGYAYPSPFAKGVAVVTTKTGDAYSHKIIDKNLATVAEIPADVKLESLEFLDGYILGIKNQKTAPKILVYSTNGSSLEIDPYKIAPQYTGIGFDVTLVKGGVFGLSFHRWINDSIPGPSDIYVRVDGQVQFAATKESGIYATGQAREGRIIVRSFTDGKKLLNDVDGSTIFATDSPYLEIFSRSVTEGRFFTVARRWLPVTTFGQPGEQVLDWSLLDQDGNVVKQDFGIGLSFSNEWWYPSITRGWTNPCQGGVSGSAYGCSPKYIENTYIPYVDRDVFYLYPQSELSAEFAEGLIRVYTADATNPESKFKGFMDRAGNLVLPADSSWMFARPFSEGKAPLRCNDEAWGFIDHTGKNITGCRYDNVAPFSEGYAFVTKLLLSKYRQTVLMNSAGEEFEIKF